jgi:hypothetical protein
MKKEELWEFIKIIQKEYKKEYPRATLTAAFAQLQDIPVACLRSSLDTVMLQHTSLPPMQRIIAATVTEYEKRKREEIEDREHQAAREKKEFSDGQQKAFKADNGIAQKTVALVRAMMGGLITRAQYLEGIRHLDNGFPTAGFATAGGELHRYYEANNLELNGRPKQEVYDDGR